MTNLCATKRAEVTFHLPTNNNHANQLSLLQTIQKVKSSPYLKDPFLPAQTTTTLSYNNVKAHVVELQVETKEGEGR